MRLTTDQQKALETAACFMRQESDARVMILKGSAGTGKTTLVSEILAQHKTRFDHVVLCAPTNKAAMVLRRKTAQPAGTLHSLLYMPQEDEETGRITWAKCVPKIEERKLIIVDEASMIGDRPDTGDGLFEGTRTLSDLLNYFGFCHPESRLLIIGDPCQLPPVGYDSYEHSPALDTDYFHNGMRIPVASAELREVVRQQQDSYVLRGATSIRDHLLYGAAQYRTDPKRLGNITAGISHYMAQYDAMSDGKVNMIAWTNKNVNWWNDVIRERLGLREAALMPGTRVVVDQRCMLEKEVLHKGQVVHIGSVNGPAETFAGLHFLPLTLQTCDEDAVVTEHECLAMLEHVRSERGVLQREQEMHLRAEAYRTNETFRKSKKNSDDRHMNALRLRYGYSMTCHKAQGSEYEDVIMHPFYPKDDPRWLYTAITRAKKELYTF